MNGERQATQTTEGQDVDVNAEAEAPPPKPAVGFGRLSLAERQAVARRGGKASQSSGKGHRWTAEEARALAPIGHQACGARKRGESA